MDWEKFIKEESEKDYMKNILSFLDKRAKEVKILPEDKNMFRLFKEGNNIPVDIVILGQDPYPTAGDANGIAFSVDRDYKLPKSLQNIFKEIYDDLGINNTSGDLTPWVKQGIFLLNTRLTVEEGRPMSHAEIGYNIFIDNVLNKIREENPDVIFMLFGKEAEKYKKYCKEENTIITTHPSPLAAYRGFSGSKVFSKANEILKRQGKEAKDWRTGSAS